MNAHIVEETRIDSFLSSIIEASRLELWFDLHWTESPTPILTIRFQGEDVPMLVADNRELLEAFRYLILEACGLSAADAPALAMVVAEGKYAVAGQHAG